MSNISVTIDTRDFNRAIAEVIREKTKSIQDSRDFQREALDLLIDYIRAYLPVDTGALRDQNSGNASKSPHYFREGSLDYLQNGIRWDAIEHRANGERHYVDVLFSKVFGGHDIETIVGFLQSTGDWDMFLKQLAEMINSYMRDN